jgi:hypothetical protein
MFGRFGKIFYKLQRLREVDNHLAVLRAEMESLRGLAEDARLRIERDGAEIHHLKDRVDTFQQRVDNLASRLQVGDRLFAEFQSWRATHPIPAEPLVSVCVATYNRSELLTERCIPSVLGQTYRHLELIVVGDGCSDDTADRLARIRDPRLSFVNLPARGDYPADPRRRWMVAGSAPANEARSRARGDFIANLDDDDEFIPDRLAKLVGFAADGGWDLVWHPFWWETSPGQWAVNEAPEMALNQVTTSSVMYRGWFKCLPADPLSHLLAEPGDWNLFRRIRFLGAACARFPEPLLRHYAERSRVDTGPAPAGDKPIP